MNICRATVTSLGTVSKRNSALVGACGIFWSSGKVQTPFFEPSCATLYLPFATWRGGPVLCGGGPFVSGHDDDYASLSHDSLSRPSYRRRKFPRGLAKCSLGQASTSTLSIIGRVAPKPTPASLCMFTFIARLLSIPFIDPNPSDDREWELIVAHFGPFNNAERCLLGTLE
jgi:hypothetical protein